MEEFVRKNPWLGLESYKEGEILYGRDDDIRDLSQCVLNDIDTLLYGKSGIGKSSILNAGILPAARRSGYLPVLIRLSHKEKHSYLYQINQAIFNAIHHSTTSELGTDVYITNGDHILNETQSLIREVVPCKNTEVESFYEYFHRHTFHNVHGDRLKLLIIFDQFEEIFTLQDDAQKKKNFFSNLADLLNDIMPNELQQKIEVSLDNQEEIIIGEERDFDNIFNDLNLGVENNLPEYVTDNEIHFVFTIREDFLSEFEYYSAAIPSLKQNRYGLRPINEEQASQIILRPMPNLIDKSVAQLIIEKITDKKDFKLDGIPEIEVDSAVLSLYLNRLYEAKDGKTITRNLVEEKGGEIISDFYNDALSELSDSTIEYLEDMLLNGKGSRDIITVYDAINDGNITEQELDILCNKKKILRQFYYAGDLRIEYVHDILCPVVKKHKEERAQIRLHEEEKRKQEELQKQFLLEEETKRREIERKAEEEKKRLEEEAKHIKKKNQQRLIGILFFLLFLGISVEGWYVLKHAPYSIYCGNFTTKNGWPIGLGVFKKKDTTAKEMLIVHYRLTREGWLPPRWGGKPYSKVEVLSADGGAATNIFINTPIVGLLESELNDERARNFANLQKKTAYWEYLPNDDEYTSVQRCTAYNLENKELYSIQYYRDNTYISNDPNKHVQWANFNDANGKQMMVTDEGVDRMRQTINNGLVTGCLFFTELGTPQRNANDAYGYLYEVDDSTSLINERYCVDKFGAKIEGTGIIFHDYEYGRMKKSSLYEVSFQPNMIVKHYRHFDDTLLFDEKKALKYGTIHPIGGEYSKIVFKYNENGSPLLNQKYQDYDLVESKSYTYSKVNRISKIDVIENGIQYTRKYEYPNDSTEILALWKDNEKFYISEKDKYNETLCFHKKIKKNTRDSIFIIETIQYEDSLGNLISGDYGKYAKYSIYRDRNKNVRLEYYYDAKGNIYKSEWFDYDEYGNRIARAAASIDGTPVRCPNWDRTGMCYYKMALLSPFNNVDKSVFVSAQGINEFGDNSFITKTIGNELFNLHITESSYRYIYRNIYGINETGIAIAETDISEASFEKSAIYIHILNKKGTFYSSAYSNRVADGIRDGDVLIKIMDIKIYPINDESIVGFLLEKIQKNGGPIVVARVNKDLNSYEVFEFVVPKGEALIETHLVELTNEEYDKINITTGV